jgi:outer membrane protein assembly factor BamB
MFRTVAAGVVLLCLAVVTLAEDWPGWRGPASQGVSTELGLPVHWSATESVAWKVPLEGAGVSAPIVWGDRIFLTASDGRHNDQLHVLCHHRADGRQLWHVRLFGTAPTDLYPPGGMAVPTPATDGKHLFALFGTGDLVCLDMNGRPLWIRSLAKEYGPFQNRWGMGSSPILIKNVEARDLLVVQVDHWGQSYLVGVDPDTGQNRWKTDRDVHVNWCSPLPIVAGGRVELVVLGSEKVQGFDAASGRVVWTADGPGDQCVPSPVPASDLIVIGTDRGSLALRPGQMKTGRPLLAWENKRARAYVPTPLHYQGCYYIAGEKGIVTCLDAATGKQLWKERLGGDFHASPVAGDGKVYFATREGTVYVLRSGKPFEPLAKNELGEMIVASPAISGGQLFFRGQRHLFCVGTRR